MVLLNGARRGLRPHWLAYCALGPGISATLAVNVAAGLAYGTVGAIVAAWPARALAISYELLMLIVRRSARPVPEPAVPQPIPEPPAALSGHGHKAADLFAADLTAGTVPGIRRIRSALNVGQPKARPVREYLTDLVGSGQVPQKLTHPRTAQARTAGFTGRASTNCPGSSRIAYGASPDA
jgi:hypothetical protein